MNITIYDIDDDTGDQVLRCQCHLSDALERDDSEYQDALRELNKSGRYWAGGGASPLVLLMRA